MQSTVILQEPMHHHASCYLWSGRLFTYSLDWMLLNRPLWCSVLLDGIG